MVLHDEPSTRGTRVYVCKGVRTEDGSGVAACVWSKVQPVAHNKVRPNLTSAPRRAARARQWVTVTLGDRHSQDLLALFRGWTQQLDEASPHCSHCNNPLVVCAARQLAKSWEGIDLSDLGNAFLVACKAGHVVGSVTMAPPELDVTIDKGCEPLVVPGL